MDNQIKILTALVLIHLFSLSFPANGNCESARVSDIVKTPVVFIHGHGMNASVWSNMLAYFNTHGYPDHYLGAISIWPNTSSNIDAAKNQISMFIDELIEQAKSTSRNNNRSWKVDIVAHSMGAVSARYYAKMIGPEKVRTIVTIGGANHGTNALCLFDDPGSKEMCPAYASTAEKSPTQILLNGDGPKSPVDETPYGVGTDSPWKESLKPDENRRITFWSIRLKKDRWIRPSSSAILDGAGGKRINGVLKVKHVITSPGNILLTEPYDHDNLTNEIGIIEATYLLLN